MKDSFIKNDADYKKYLDEFEKLMSKDPARESSEGERLLLLIGPIKEYEESHFFFQKPSAIDAIKFRMEEQGLKPNDLMGCLGRKSRISEILNGKRKLSSDEPDRTAINTYLYKVRSKNLWD